MPQESNQTPDQVNNAAKSASADSTRHSQDGHAAAQPSGPKGDNPATAGHGETRVHSSTPENATGHLNPSAPEDANATPGSTTVK